jgi:D-glycero-beta-D-manno-heptose-7-phosphate kinase
MHPARVRDILGRGASTRILVIGDVILDEFVWGDVSRISPEAPVPVVRVTGESWYPGGAANVARNVRQFTAHVDVAGVTGDDEHGRRLGALLAAEGIGTGGILIDGERCTVVKTRVLAKHQQVVRVDREKIAPLGGELEARAVEHLRRLASEADAVIVSDYAKGFLGQTLADELRRIAAETRCIVTVDPSPANPLDWRGVTAIKPNRGEALRAAGYVEGRGGDMRAIGTKLLETWTAGIVLLTLGEEGMLLFERGAEPYHTPTRAREVYDVSGAGDTAIAVFTLALAAGASAREAAELANQASGIVVGKLGTATVGGEELAASLDSRETGR